MDLLEYQARDLFEAFEVPVLPGRIATTPEEARAAYADGLRAARQLLGETYGFAAENLGDSNGDGGW